MKKITIKINKVGNRKTTEKKMKPNAVFFLSASIKLINIQPELSGNAIVNRQITNIRNERGYYISLNYTDLNVNKDRS